MSEGPGMVRLPRDAAHLCEHCRQRLLHRSRQRWPMLAALLPALDGAAGLSWQPALRPLLAWPVVPPVLLATWPWLVPLFGFHRWKRAASGGLPAMPDLLLGIRADMPAFGAGEPGRGGVRFVPCGALCGESLRAGRGLFFCVQGGNGGHRYLPERSALREDVQRVPDAGTPA